MGVSHLKPTPGELLMIVYEGPSAYNGKPIVAILTGLGRTSKNPKTGDMCQLWILGQDEAPTQASKNGTDDSVCGDCPYRHANQGGCYVVLYQAPLQVWKKYKRGGYEKVAPEAAAEKLKGRMVRLGAYGDPAMLPFEVVKPLTEAANGFTGYTHQWNAEWIDERFASLCMASVDSLVEYSVAKSKGWRCFMVALNAASVADFATINCPASEENGKKTTCQKCGLCNGMQKANDKRKDIYILPHGNKKGRILNREQATV